MGPSRSSSGNALSKDGLYSQNAFLAGEERAVANAADIISETHNLREQFVSESGLGGSLSSKREANAQQRGETKGSTFPEKLMALLETRAAPEAIFWLEGPSVTPGSIGINKKIFERDLLHSTFNSNKWSTTKRNLSRWGFRQVNFPHLPRHITAFHNPLFQSNRPDLLQSLTKKKSSKAKEAIQQMQEDQEKKDFCTGMVADYYLETSVNKTADASKGEHELPSSPSQRLDTIASYMNLRNIDPTLPQRFPSGFSNQQQHQLQSTMISLRDHQFEQQGLIGLLSYRNNVFSQVQQEQQQQHSLVPEAQQWQLIQSQMLPQQWGLDATLQTLQQQSQCTWGDNTHIHNAPNCTNDTDMQSNAREAP